MQHFIITRFNDYFPTFDAFHARHVYPTMSNPDLGINEEWLSKRLRLFTKFTIPSINHQTNKDFIWVLKCHPKTPLWAKKLLTGNFLACYDEQDPQRSVNLQASYSFAKIIRKLTNDKEIITTRLDSDDALSSRHVEIVQNNIVPNRFFDFARGIVWIKGDIFLHHKPRTSQFCSYMEVTDRPSTVYHKYHSQIQNSECIKHLGDFGWMQTNHDSNIANGLKETKKYPVKATDFDFDNLHASYPWLFRPLFL